MKKSTQKSISKRIRVTKNGKVVRRAMGLGHSRANKSQQQIRRRQKSRGLNNVGVDARKYFL